MLFGLAAPVLLHAAARLLPIVRFAAGSAAAAFARRCRLTSRFTCCGCAAFAKAVMIALVISLALSHAAAGADAEVTCAVRAAAFRRC